MSIRYLKNSDINIEAWDHCITNSFNSNIYSFSWYLDLLCDRWDALVEDDYTSVMPLPVFRYLGLQFVSRHHFINELGIYSGLPIGLNKTSEFLFSAQKHFNLYSTILNKYNPVSPVEHDCHAHFRYELDLIKPYPKIRDKYNSLLKRDLHMADSRKFFFISGIAANDLIRFITEKAIVLPAALKRNNHRMLRILMAGLIRYQSGDSFAVYDSHNELCSVAMFGWNNSKISLLFHIVSPEGAAVFAHGWLIDQFIRKYAETNSTLVFYKNPASDLGMNYTEFGANEAVNFEVRYNKLIFPMNVIMNQRILTTLL